MLVAGRALFTTEFKINCFQGKRWGLCLSNARVSSHSLPFETRLQSPSLLISGGDPLTDPPDHQTEGIHADSTLLRGRNNGSNVRWRGWMSCPFIYVNIHVRGQGCLHEMHFTLKIQFCPWNQWGRSTKQWLNLLNQLLMWGMILWTCFKC